MERLKPYKMENPKGEWEEWVSILLVNLFNLSVRR